MHCFEYASTVLASKADVGIVMGQSKAFLLFAEHFGIQLRPLSDALLHPPSAAATGKVIHRDHQTVLLLQIRKLFT